MNETFVSKFKKSIVVQLLLSYVFIVSGLIVNLLQLCTLIVWPFDKLLYRKLNYYLGYSLWSNLTSMAQWWSGSDIELFMNEDDFKKYVGKENIVCVVNHKYDTDWLFGWLICQRVGMLGGSKVIFKSAVKYLPIMGWSWIFTENIFVKRVWETDKKSLVKDLHSIFDFPTGYYFGIVIFCEGTRFTQEKHKISMEYAREKNLPELKHHLLPRSKGFSLLMSQAKHKVNAIYDVTLGIVKQDDKTPNLNNIKNGEAVQSKAVIRRIPIEQVPCDDENKCAEFLQKLYVEKDKIFDTFDRTGDFSHSTENVKKIKLHKNKYDLFITLFWITLILPPSVYYLLRFLWFGSFYVKLAFCLIVILVNLMIKHLVNTSLIKHGSSFGLKKTN